MTRLGHGSALRLVAAQWRCGTSRLRAGGRSTGSGHTSGRKADPLYRCRKLLAMAEERLDEAAGSKLRGLLAAGNPDGSVGEAGERRKLFVTSIASTASPSSPDGGSTASSTTAATPPPRRYRGMARTLKRWRGPDPGLEHHRRLQRAHRRPERDHREGKAGGSRLAVLRQLPAPDPACRRGLRLVALLDFAPH